jgi:hypothetical protein
VAIERGRVKTETACLGSFLAIFRMGTTDGEQGLGGDGGIRTLDRALQPYNGLASRYYLGSFELGRSFVGIECSEANFAIAHKRIAEAIRARAPDVR